MNLTTKSRDLLYRYILDSDEDAFTEIVRRHLSLVYSTALRSLGGDRSLAEDCAQTVFVDLVRKAAKISPNASLAAWLHRHTRFTASKMVDSEVRRQRREWGISARRQRVQHPGN